jgi:hypothetical protein
MIHPTAVVVSTPTRIFTASIRHLQLLGFKNAELAAIVPAANRIFTTEQSAVFAVSQKSLLSLDQGHAVSNVTHALGAGD